MHEIRGHVGTAAAILCALLATGARGATGEQAAPAGAAGASYQPATTCATCHRTIHLYWSESEHGRAAVKPSFLESLRLAVESADDKSRTRRDCVACHAPTARVTGDFELKQALTREGVSCDFCHTVADVDLGRAGDPFDLRPGPVKRGPLLYAKSSAHQTEYSTLHRSSSLLCAGCHEYRNALGVDVLSTYSEWTAGPYPARGTTCQECHMPVVPGATVPEVLKPTQRVVNLHRMPGGGTATQLQKGLTLHIDSLAVGATSADVQVSVTNSGVGHSAPGGLSTKALVLAVGVEGASGGELLYRQEKIYRRELRDAEGHPLVRASDLFLRAASVGEDTRLKPRESRSERFTVPVPEGAKSIVVRLEYRDASDPTGPPRTTLIAEERRAPRSTP